MSEYIITEQFANGVGITEKKETEVKAPEVVAKAQRRRLTTAYKLRILSEADACSKPGELGALLRREGLYHSSLQDWRRKRDEGAFGALAPRKRGPKSAADPELVRELTKQNRRIAQLEKKLAQAELIIDIQKKVSVLLGIDLDAKSE